MKKNNLEKMWKFAKNEITESKGYILTILFIFSISTIFGFAFSDDLSFLDAFLKNLLSQVKDLTGIRLAFYIFMNNVQSALFGMLFGVIMGFVPVFTSLFNGLVIGYVLAKVTYADGIIQTWKILPHGIFELPAIFIALGIGLKLGVSVFSQEGRNKLFNNIYRAILVFIFVVIPLLIIAAIIESLVISFYK